MQFTELLLAEHSLAAFLSHFDQGHEKVLCTQSPLQDQSINAQGYRPAGKKYTPGLYSTSQLWCVPSVKDDELLCCLKGTVGSFL